MKRHAATGLPDALARELDGARLPEKWGRAYTLATAGTDGEPRIAMVSIGDVVALDPFTVRIGLWRGTRTGRNLRQQRRGSLVVVTGGRTYHVALAAQRTWPVTVAGMALDVFECRVEGVEDDAHPPIVATSGPQFDADDPEPLLEQWQAAVEAIGAAPPDGPETLAAAREPVTRDQWRDAGRCALLIIDIQNDYCHPDGVVAGLGVARDGIERMCDHVEKVQRAARNAGVPVIFVRSIHGDRTNSAVWLSRSPVAGSTCRPGSFGIEFYRIHPEPGDTVITKTRYSAFIDTELEEVLRRLHRDVVVVTGTQTNVCVESTIRDAFQRDFYTAVVADASATDTPAAHAAALSTIGKWFGAVIDSDDLVAAWHRHGAGHEGSTGGGLRRESVRIGEGTGIAGAHQPR